MFGNNSIHDFRDLMRAQARQKKQPPFPYRTVPLPQPQTSMWTEQLAPTQIQYASACAPRRGVGRRSGLYAQAAYAKYPRITQIPTASTAPAPISEASYTVTQAQAFSVTEKNQAQQWPAHDTSNKAEKEFDSYFVDSACQPSFTRNSFARLHPSKLSVMLPDG